MTPLTLPQVNRKLNDLILEIEQVKSKMNMSKPPRHTPDERVSRVTDAVERAYELPTGMVFAKTNRSPIPEARYMCMVLLNKTTDIRRYEIAMMFGKHPAAIGSAMKVIGDRVLLERVVREKWQDVCVELGWEGDV